MQLKKGKRYLWMNDIIVENVIDMKCVILNNESYVGITLDFRHSLLFSELKNQDKPQEI